MGAELTKAIVVGGSLRRPTAGRLHPREGPSVNDDRRHVSIRLRDFIVGPGTTMPADGSYGTGSRMFR
jgi:hypothetical protein